MLIHASSIHAHEFTAIAVARSFHVERGRRYFYFHREHSLVVDASTLLLVDWPCWLWIHTVTPVVRKPGRRGEWSNGLPTEAGRLVWLMAFEAAAYR